jgi:hypothetical protein
MFQTYLRLNCQESTINLPDEKLNDNGDTMHNDFIESSENITEKQHN